MRLARWELASLFGRSIQKPIDDFHSWDPGFVNITLTRSGILCASMGAHAQHVPDAVREAVRSACLDDRFGHTVVFGDFDSVGLELWIELQRSRLSNDPDRIARELHLGADGIRITLGSHRAYYKPSVAITGRVRTPQKLLEKLCKKAGLPETAWLDPVAHIERSAWISAVERPGPHLGFVSLHKLRSLPYRHVSPETIQSALELSVGRMLATQKSDGAFGYLYRPFEDKWKPGSNRVRQAGCAYAAARAADHAAVTDQGLARAAASRAIGSLMLQTASCPSTGGLFVREKDSGTSWGKLGATALTALAAQYSAGRPWDAEAALLIRHLLQSQNPDGSFQCITGRDATPDEEDSNQNFFSGESLMALHEYSHRTGDPRGDTAASNAFTHYRNHFRLRPATAFVAWHADVWSRIAGNLLRQPSQRMGQAGPAVLKICLFVFEQIEWLLSQQYTQAHNCPPEYVGGFKVPHPPTFSTAVFVEAIIRACDLAEAVGDHARLRQYREAALRGLGFLLRLQVRPETSLLFPNPTLAVGGLTTTLESFEMRCDYDQHFVTACITALDSSVLWAADSTAGHAAPVPMFRSARS